jgi:hypothetical protein
MTANIMIISGFRASSRLSLSPYYSLTSLQRRLHASYPSHSPPHRHREMVEMTRRRIHGNGDSADKAKSKAKSPTTGAVGEREHHDHDHRPSNTQPHTHSHSHGIFGGHSHSHSHGHGHDGHDHGGGLIETLQSGGAHLSTCPHSHFCLCIYDGSHVSHSSFVLPPPPPSLSRHLLSRILKVTEEVALHLLGWARTFS